MTQASTRYTNRPIIKSYANSDKVSLQSCVDRSDTDKTTWGNIEAGFNFLIVWDNRSSSYLTMHNRAAYCRYWRAIREQSTRIYAKHSG